MNLFRDLLSPLLAVATMALHAGEAPYAPKTATGSLGKIERRDAELDHLLAPHATLEILAEGFDWSEGPVWMTRGGFLVFADVPKNVVWKWREFEGLTEYLKPSGYTGRSGSGSESGANGLTVDNDGRLILCQHGDRQVARLKQRTHFEPLATNFEGKRLNSPNDIVMRNNGDLYFTDPPYGLAKGTNDPRKELPFQGIYRITRRGRIQLLNKELTYPNGLAFSPDESRLYVAVSDPARAHYVAFEVSQDGSLGRSKVLYDATPLVAGRKGLPDGLKVDIEGNLWATGPGGVLVLNADGRHLGTIETGEATGNCAWGDDGSVLYITADTYLCRIKTKTRGRLPGPLPENRR